MSEFITVARVGAIPEGSGGTFQVGDRLVAVFNRGGEYFAIDDLCPHMGAARGAGDRDEEGVVTVPGPATHLTRSDGTRGAHPRIKIDAFETRVVDDEIQVRRTPNPK